MSDPSPPTATGLHTVRMALWAAVMVLLAGAVVLVSPWGGRALVERASDGVRSIAAGCGTVGSPAGPALWWVDRAPLLEPAARTQARMDLFRAHVDGVAACARSQSVPPALQSRTLSLARDTLGVSDPKHLRIKDVEYVYRLLLRAGQPELVQRLPIPRALRGDSLRLRVTAHLLTGDLAGAAALYKANPDPMTESDLLAPASSPTVVLCEAGEVDAGLEALSSGFQVSADVAAWLRARCLTVGQRWEALAVEPPHLLALARSTTHIEGPAAAWAQVERLRSRAEVELVDDAHTALWVAWLAASTLDPDEDAEAILTAARMVLAWHPGLTALLEDTRLADPARRAAWLKLDDPRAHPAFDRTQLARLQAVVAPLDAVVGARLAVSLALVGHWQRPVARDWLTEARTLDPGARTPDEAEVVIGLYHAVLGQESSLDGLATVSAESRRLAEQANAGWFADRSPLPAGFDLSRAWRAHPEPPFQAAWAVVRGSELDVERQLALLSTGPRPRTLREWVAHQEMLAVQAETTDQAAVALRHRARAEAVSGLLMSLQGPCPLVDGVGPAVGVLAW